MLLWKLYTEQWNTVPVVSGSTAVARYRLSGLIFVALQLFVILTIHPCLLNISALPPMQQGVISPSAWVFNISGSSWLNDTLIQTCQVIHNWSCCRAFETGTISTWTHFIGNMLTTLNFSLIAYSLTLPVSQKTIRNIYYPYF